MQQITHDAQSVSLDGASGFGNFHYCVHQSLHNLCFGGAPGELNAGVNAPLRQISFGKAGQFSGYSFSLEILDRLNRGLFWHHQYPAAGLIRTLRVDQFTYLDDVRLSLQNPVVSGQSEIQSAIGDVGRHLLGTDQGAPDVRVIDRREIVPRMG